MTAWRHRRWPLLGHRPGFQADATGFLLHIAREQGDVARFRLGRTEAVLLSHPDHVRQVLVDRADDFTKGRLMQRARRLLGDGLLTSEGELHRRQRRSIQPVFTREHLQSYASLMPALIAGHTAAWQHGEIIRVDAEMDALAMRLVVRALLGTDVEEEAPALGRALRRLSRWAPLLAAPGGRLFESIRLPGVGRLADAIDIIERIIHRHIEDGPSQGTLLKALFRCEGQPMPAQQVRDEVMTIFLAGHDTTSAALTWVWLLLAGHELAGDRLREELASVLGGRDPKPEDLSHLPYTDAVVRETLRLYPPIGRIGRRPICDIELDGIVLKKGSAVFLSPFVTGRDPRWFPQAEHFEPERWNQRDASRPRFAWFPFGAGPRSCIGEHFARMVLTMALAAVAQRWRLRPTMPDLPKVRSLLTLKPRGAVHMITELSSIPIASG